MPLGLPCKAWLRLYGDILPDPSPSCSPEVLLGQHLRFRREQVVELDGSWEVALPSAVETGWNLS